MSIWTNKMKPICQENVQKFYYNRFDCKGVMENAMTTAICTDEYVAFCALSLVRSGLCDFLPQI